MSEVSPRASAWRWARWLTACAAIGFWVWLFVVQVEMPLMVHSLAFEDWYGNWRDAFIVSAVFLAFVLGFAWPRGAAQWRNAGVYSAFLISLFVEMFGIPLTIYAIAPFLRLEALDFGRNESHLWAFLLDQAGLVPLAWGVYLMMTLSMALVAAGLALVAVGWAQVYGARHGLMTAGIYRYVRHPQYLGLILVVVALNIQWPTIPTLLMGPALIVMYVRQARREDKDLGARFGDAFAAYRARVPAFIPRLRGRNVLAGQANKLQRSV
jgi:protein-S-isoprenylcysteine O-methyltransferase Ste14